MRHNFTTQTLNRPQISGRAAVAARLLTLLAAITITAGCSAEKATTTDTGALDAGVVSDAGGSDTLAADSAAADAATTDAGASTDGWVDSGGVVSENTNTLCDDGVDNDNDGKTDCDDLSCSLGIGVTVCEPVRTNTETTDATCKDGKDNDNDGKTDCDDPDCKDSTLVTVCDVTTTGKEDNDVACQDGKDNDNNGYTDCNDFGCSKNAKVTVCGAAAKCGDGKCDGGETATSCAKDCAKPSATSCIGKCGESSASASCQCDAECTDFGDCCKDYATVCKPTKPVCGDGKCETGETKTNCAKDCDVKPTGSCKGKCGDYDANASCQCDSDCVGAKDCCSDIKAVCGDVTTPSTSCLATPWHQQVSATAARPRVVADGKAVWLAAGALMRAAEPGAKLATIPWTAKACIGAACVDQPVHAEGVVVDPAGGVVAAGLYAEVTAATWNQGVVARFDASGKQVWSHTVLAAGVAKTAGLGVFGAVAAGNAGKTLVAAALKEGGGDVARVWAVDAAGLATETTWKLPAGIAEVHGLAWSATDGLRAAGLAAGGGWLGGVTKGASWQVALAGVSLAADVALTEKGDCYVVGHTTVAAGVDSWLGRYDSAGKQLWVSKLGGGAQDRFDRVITVQQGAVLAGATADKAGVWRAWLVATDVKGIVQAQNSHGLPALNAAATGVAMPDPEGVLLAARLGPASKPTGVWLVRVDGNGDGPCSDKSSAACGAETVPCDDGQACTMDACDAKTGKCTHSAAAASAACEDGNVCTGAGVCKAGACTAGAAVADGQVCGAVGKCQTGVCVGDKATAPKVGDLVFSEVMVRAISGTTDDAEWIELTNVSKVTLDLEGLSLVEKGTPAVKLTGGSASLKLKPGGHFVIGRSSNAGKNNGVTVDFVQTKIQLGNSGGDLSLKAGSLTLDAFSYAKAQVALGVALQLSQNKLDPKSNDDAKAWCPATASYGAAGMKGTPGADNAVCK